MLEMKQTLRNYPFCQECDDAILSPYVMQVGSEYYHEDCLKCADCGCVLSSKCYVRDKKLLCSQDYKRRKCCFKCGKFITSNEFIHKVKICDETMVSHVSCFSCISCKLSMKSGDEFIMTDEGDLLCTDEHCVQTNKERNCLKSDSEANKRRPSHDCVDRKSLELLSEIDMDESFKEKSNSDFEWLDSSNLDEVSGPDSSEFKISAFVTTSINKESEQSGINSELHDGSKKELQETVVGKTKGKRRGPRTTIKPTQLEALKAAFQASQKPTKNTREKLSKETGLEMRVIQVWFQNRRSKERRVNQTTKISSKQAFFEAGLMSKLRNHNYPFYNSNFSDPYNYSQSLQSAGQYLSDGFNPQTYNLDSGNFSNPNSLSHFDVSPSCVVNKSYGSQCLFNVQEGIEKEQDLFRSGNLPRNHECLSEVNSQREKHLNQLVYNPLYNKFVDTNITSAWTL